MSKRHEICGLQVASSIYNLISEEIIPGTNLSESKFWQSFAEIIEKFSPLNDVLLNERETLQLKINSWHQKNSKLEFNFPKF